MNKKYKPDKINWVNGKGINIKNNYLLELKNVSLSFDKGKTYVLKDISFGVKSGEVVSIIGMNGTGKSSLLKIISGIYKKTFGEIIKNYKNISYVPQKLSIDKTFPIKVYEFIKIYNPGTKDEKIKEYLEKFSSLKLFDKNISKLSGGEFQKILIISSLLSNPDLMLMDEPTAGIDLSGEEKFYEIIAETKKLFPNISIILVSHNISLVYKNSDKVICLHENNFCCHGTPHELQNNIEIENIFGKYMLPYEHHPHKKNEHEKI